MKVIDPGHVYELNILDEGDIEYHNLVFVKREGEKYPGNVGHHAGTNLQEVLRACIDRLKYVDSQLHNFHNDIVLNHLRMSLYHLETRAAERHNRRFHQVELRNIELVPTCSKCGHIECKGECRGI